MTRFEDGPAKGKCLALKHCPQYLRVTEQVGKFDALDAPGDTPNVGERLTAYRLLRRDGTAHVNFGRRGGGWYPIATYVMVQPQPTDQEMRMAALWDLWCKTRPA